MRVYQLLEGQTREPQCTYAAIQHHADVAGCMLGEEFDRKNEKDVDVVDRDGVSLQVQWQEVFICSFFTV